MIKDISKNVKETKNQNEAALDLIVVFKDEVDEVMIQSHEGKLKKRFSNFHMTSIQWPEKSLATLKINP